MFAIGSRVVVTNYGSEKDGFNGKQGTVVYRERGSNGFTSVVLDDKDFTERFMTSRDWVYLFDDDEIALEPYEFMGYMGDNSGNAWSYALRYRCYRGKCNGSAVQTADRNTHNGFHNRNGH